MRYMYRKLLLSRTLKKTAPGSSQRPEAPRPAAGRDEEEEEAAVDAMILPPPPVNGRNAFADGSLGAVNRTYM
jgi:hypothetical protein